MQVSSPIRPSTGTERVESGVSGVSLGVIAAVRRVILDSRRCWMVELISARRSKPSAAGRNAKHRGAASHWIWVLLLWRCCTGNSSPIGRLLDRSRESPEAAVAIAIAEEIQHRSIVGPGRLEIPVFAIRDRNPPRLRDWLIRREWRYEKSGGAPRPGPALARKAITCRPGRSGKTIAPVGQGVLVCLPLARFKQRRTRRLAAVMQHKAPAEDTSAVCAADRRRPSSGCLPGVDLCTSDGRVLRGCRNRTVLPSLRINGARSGVLVEVTAPLRRPEVSHPDIDLAGAIEKRLPSEPSLERRAITWGSAREENAGRIPARGPCASGRISNAVNV
jgi:hypothetical protein